MKRWSELSPDERNKIVADTIMDGEPGRYTEDLNEAYRVAAAMTFAPQGKQEWQQLHLKISPLFTGQQVGRCSACFGHNRETGIFFGAPTPAQAICLEALNKFGVQFEDGEQLYSSERESGGKRGSLVSIEYY